MRSVLEQSGVRSLAELKQSKQITTLESPIRALGKELGICFSGTSPESQLAQCLDSVREAIARSQQKDSAEEEIRKCN